MVSLNSKFEKIFVQSRGDYRSAFAEISSRLNDFNPAEIDGFFQKPIVNFVSGKVSHMQSISGFAVAVNKITPLKTRIFFKSKKKIGI